MKNALILLSLSFIAMNSFAFDGYYSDMPPKKVVKTKRRVAAVEQRKLQHQVETTTLNESEESNSNNRSGVVLGLGMFSGNDQMQLSVVDKVDQSVGNNSSKSKLNSPDFSLGYAYLPMQSLGLISKVAYSQGTESSSVKLSIKNYRLEESLAFLANENVDVHAGLNISKFKIGNGPIELESKAKIGYQVGLTLHFNQNVGLTIDYIKLRNDLSANNYSTLTSGSIENDGVKAGLNFTF
jgi:hypothetical protein